MAIVLDAGALIAIDKSDARVNAILAEARRTGQQLRVPSGVVAQAWRGGSRQAVLSRVLKSVKEFPLDEKASRRAGELLKRSHTSDVIDASVVDVALSGDVVLTSDPVDIEHLARTAQKRLLIVTV
jgi:predicted nucleic acid-binding protein